MIWELKSLRTVHFFNIFALGPLMETFDDFWRMMWEQMCSVIIMLTKLEERGRVSKDNNRNENDNNITLCASMISVYLLYHAMLCFIIQRKCDQYWPERGTRKYGQVQVTLKETLNMSHYTVRKMVMSHKLVR